MKYKEYILMENTVNIDYNRLRLHIIPLLSDNYGYILEGKEALLVLDPGESAPILSIAKGLGKPISDVLITHGDYDHVGGLSDIVDMYYSKVYGPDGMSTPVHTKVKEGDDIECLGESIEILSTPGHSGHCVSYYFSGFSAVFVGDCLFVGGCGRVFSGNPASLWHSIKKLKELPENTDVYVGHEYTLSNYRFALSILENDPDIKNRAEEMQSRLVAGGISVPTTIGEERKSNIFMRCDSTDFAEILDCKGATAEAVFTKLRKLKDEF